MSNLNKEAKKLVDSQIEQALNKPPEGKYEYRIVWTDGTSQIVQTNYTPQYSGNIVIMRKLDDKEFIFITLNMRYLEMLRFPVSSEDSKIITPDGRAANAASIITGN